jgi:hypothetical protein
MTNYYFRKTLRSVAVVRIVHKMPVSEYGSVKKSHEEWYDH